MRPCTSLVALLLGAGTAAAQGAPTPPTGTTPATTPPAAPAPSAPPPEDIEPADIQGISEDPVLVAPKPEPSDPVAAPVTRAAWPTEEVWRPLTLPALQTEFRLDLPVRPLVFSTDVVLGVRFGATRNVEIGLDYNVGGSYTDNSTSPVFNIGKGMQLSATYQIFPSLAARLAVPMYFDPFAIGIIAGAPTKFRISEKFALGTNGDMLNIRAHNFVPSWRSEMANEGNGRLVATNSQTSRGSVRIVGHAWYQLQPTMVLLGQLGVEWPDFDTLKVIYPLKAGAQYTLMQNRLDVVGWLGFDDLTTADDSLAIDLGVRFRL